MAVNYGSTNTNRYHIVADSDDFNLPNGDWSWLVIFNPSVGGSVFPYFLSHGGTFGGANTVQLFHNGPNGFACSVAGLSTRNWGGGNMSSHVGKWMVGYGTRRSGSLYAGAAPINEPWNAFESAGTAISSAYTPATSLKIGIRSDLTSDATYSTKSRISDAIYIPGYGLSINDLRRLVSCGVCNLEDEPWWHLRSFHAWLRTSNDAEFSDLTGNHKITRNGTGYSADESELFPISRDEDRNLFVVTSPLFAASGGDINLTLAQSAQSDASGTGLLTQGHVLVGANAAQTDAAVSVALTQSHVLSASNQSQTDSSAIAAITQSHAISASASTQTDNSTTLSITQTHALSAAVSIETDTSGTGEISLSGGLLVDNCSQTDASATSAIAQTHNLILVATTQTDSSATGAITLGSVINLSLANNAQADTCATSSITQTHVLVMDPSVQDDIAASSAIVQQHMLAGSSCVEIDLSGTGVISNYTVVNAPSGSGYIAGIVESSRPVVQGKSSRITSASRARPTYN